MNITFSEFINSWVALSLFFLKSLLAIVPHPLHKHCYISRVSLVVPVPSPSRNTSHK